MAADATRVRFAPAEGAARLFTPTFCEYLARLHDALGAPAPELRARRAEELGSALGGGPAGMLCRRGARPSPPSRRGRSSKARAPRRTEGHPAETQSPTYL